MISTDHASAPREMARLGWPCTFTPLICLKPSAKARAFSVRQAHGGPPCLVAFAKRADDPARPSAPVPSHHVERHALRRFRRGVIGVALAGPLERLLRAE